MEREILCAAEVCQLLNIDRTTLQKLTGHCLFPSSAHQLWDRAAIENFQRHTHDVDLTNLANAIEPERPRPIRRHTSALNAPDLLHDDTIDNPDEWLSIQEPLNEDLDEADKWLRQHGVNDYE